MNKTAPIATPTTGTIVAIMITSGLTPASGVGAGGGITTESLSAAGVFRGESGFDGAEGSVVGSDEGGSEGVPGSITVATHPRLMGLVR
jgi:hypothetical protein